MKHSKSVVQTAADDLMEFNEEEFNVHSKIKTPVKPFTEKLVRVKDERVLKDLTIVVYYEDPVLPHALREIMNLHENKRLLVMAEVGIPSWTVVLS